MNWTLRIAGALALIVGAALIVVGCLAYSAGVADTGALLDALDTIGVGALGALIGVGLIVHASRTRKRSV